MKTKRKLITLMLAFAVCIFCWMFAACDNGGGDDAANSTPTVYTYESGKLTLTMLGTTEEQSLDSSYKGSTAYIKDGKLYVTINGQEESVECTYDGEKYIVPVDMSGSEAILESLGNGVEVQMECYVTVTETTLNYIVNSDGYSDGQILCSTRVILTFTV